MSIEINNLSVSYNGKSVVEDISLQAKSGEILAILGPSGSGKTSILLAIAGLLPNKAKMKGTILVQEKDITHVAAEMRNIPLMFQNYALFPDKTVQGNISFGLKMQHRPSHEIKQKTNEILKILKIQDKGSRYPHELSGGEQQRVALGRLLVLKPDIMLLDEPIGALDNHLREKVMSELKSLQKQIGFTLLYVTHNQDEAMFLADRIGIINNGSLIQVGSSQDVYSHPINDFVARFLGLTNLLQAKAVHVTQKETIFCTNNIKFEVSSISEKIHINHNYHLLIHPENIHISESGDGYPAKIEDVIYKNGIRYCRLRVDDIDEPILTSMVNQRNLKKGDNIKITWIKDSVIALNEI